MANTISEDANNSVEMSLLENNAALIEENTNLKNKLKTLQDEINELNSIIVKQDETIQQNRRIISELFDNSKNSNNKQNNIKTPESVVDEYFNNQ